MEIEKFKALKKEAHFRTNTHEFVAHGAGRPAAEHGLEVVAVADVSNVVGKRIPKIFSRVHGYIRMDASAWMPSVPSFHVDNNNITNVSNANDLEAMFTPGSARPVGDNFVGIDPKMPFFF